MINWGNHVCLSQYGAVIGTAAWPWVYFVMNLQIMLNRKNACEFRYIKDWEKLSTLPATGAGFFKGQNVCIYFQSTGKKIK